MSELITISNDYLTVKISTYGAEVNSITYENKERIWQGDKNVWADHSPVLFPFCGRLNDGVYTYKNDKYEQKIHGFAKRSQFEVVSLEKSSVTFLLSYNEDTLKIYPFKFNFRVYYKLNGTSLGVYYMVENLDDKDMYYNVGCHDAYMIDDTIENYSILFDGYNDKITCVNLNKGYIFGDKFELPLINGELHLNNKLFDEKSEIAKNVISTQSILVENLNTDRYTLLKNGEPQVSVYAKDFKNFVLWTIPNSKFIAIEPWDGLPAEKDKGYAIETKRSISILKKGEQKTFYHSITF